MEKLIERGTEPLFGYPTVLYDERIETGKWPFMKVLTEYAISMNEHKNSIPKLLQSIKDENEREATVIHKFQKGIKVSKELPKQPEKVK